MRSAFVLRRPLRGVFARFAFLRLKGLTHAFFDVFVISHVLSVTSHKPAKFTARRGAKSRYPAAGYGRKVEKQRNRPKFGPAPILAIHILAFVGVFFWASTIVQALAAGLPNGWTVIPIGIVLGGAHIAISRFTARHDRRAVAVMWFVFIADALLAIFVNYLAVILVLFTVVLLILARTSPAKEWFTSPNS
jgi:hypothetical protein